MFRLDDLLPFEADLPGTGWLAIAGELAEHVEGAGEMLDCVGPDFPEDDITETTESDRFFRLPGALVYGIAVEFSNADAAHRAADILEAEAFTSCLASSVAHDLAGTDAEILDVAVLSAGRSDAYSAQRATFTGGGSHGIASVHLDIVVVRAPLGLGVVWFADRGGPFPERDRGQVLTGIVGRAGPG